jgi:hypothetical protein
MLDLLYWKEKRKKFTCNKKTLFSSDIGWV